MKKIFINYKIFLVVPILLVLFSTVVLFNNYVQTGEWFKRSFELTGGTLITLGVKEPIDIKTIENALSDYEVNIREIRSFTGHSILIQTTEDVNATKIIDDVKNTGIDVAQFSIQRIGPALGESFWQQTQIAILIAFVFMSIIVFLLFRTSLPSFYVILSAMSDIVVTLAIMQILNIDLSLAGLGALLMLMGYSIDTDILLTTRFMKTSEAFNERFRSALKTGLTMSATTLGALIALFLSSLSPLLTQIASVLLIGLTVDIIMTWMQNSVLLRWYMESRRLI
jgi:preprotein translocase subunit SecF